MRGGNLKLKDFIDETAEKAGTDINRAALMAIQGYHSEVVVFGNAIIKTNDEGETETITFSENGITKQFVGKKTITQTITFTKNGYTKELS